MHVLIAPDCFGDSLTAAEAAAAIAAGWRLGRPGDAVTLAPQSDGGPGFLEVLTARGGGPLLRHCRVSGPLDAEVDADWVFDPGHPDPTRAGAAADGAVADGAVADGAVAYIESAQACGLALLGGPPSAQTAVAAHSRGVGQLVEAALDAGARTVVVGLGGSACTDGGRGMIEALGGPRAAAARLDGVRLIAATDVEHRLLGPSGAAHVFGPQKGADQDTVAALESRMLPWADELESATGRPVRDLPGAGAAGGLGFALLALGGSRESGAALVAERTGLAADLEAADLVITGEGRLDDQSLHGKVVGALARLARAAGVPLVVLAGQVVLDAAARRSAGIAAAHSVSDHAGSVRRAIDEAAGQLAGLARRTAEGPLPE